MNNCFPNHDTEKSNVKNKFLFHAPTRVILIRVDDYIEFGRKMNYIKIFMSDARPNFSRPDVRLVRQRKQTF